MSRERITISIRKGILSEIDKLIDGDVIRNRSHAIEQIVLKNAGNTNKNALVFLLGGENIDAKISIAKTYLSQAKSAGFDDIYVATGEDDERIREELGDGSKFHVSLTYHKGEGSGGSLRLLKNLLKSTFVVINTESKNIRDLSELLSFHRKINLLGTIFTKDEHTFSGIYVFEPEVLNRLKRGYTMIEEDLLPILLEKNEAVATYL
ncbi:MAG: sugar phosphate nucleotidyltransferase [Candidatus Berkelbacteria bacterium]